MKGALWITPDWLQSVRTLIESLLNKLLLCKTHWVNTLQKDAKTSPWVLYVGSFACSEIKPHWQILISSFCPDVEWVTQDLAAKPSVNRGTMNVSQPFHTHKEPIYSNMPNYAQQHPRCRVLHNLTASGTVFRSIKGVVFYMWYNCRPWPGWIDGVPSPFRGKRNL